MWQKPHFQQNCLSKMTVSLSSGPLMSEYLIALMMVSVCICCERAGARLRPRLSHVGSSDFGETGCRHEARQEELLLPAMASPAAALALVPTCGTADIQSSASGLLPEKHSEGEMEELQWSLRPWINSSCLLLQHTMKRV